MQASFPELVTSLSNDPAIGSRLVTPASSRGSASGMRPAKEGKARCDHGVTQDELDEDSPEDFLHFTEFLDATNPYNIGICGNSDCRGAHATGHVRSPPGALGTDSPCD